MEPTQAVSCHEAIEHDEYPVHQWRVTQLKRLGIPGPLAEADADKNEYLVIYGTARITEGGAAELLRRLARSYLGPDVRFPPMDSPPTGYITHIAVDRVSGVGPWAPS